MMRMRQRRKRHSETLGRRVVELKGGGASPQPDFGRVLFLGRLREGFVGQGQV